MKVDIRTKKWKKENRRKGKKFSKDLESLLRTLRILKTFLMSMKNNRKG